VHRDNVGLPGLAKYFKDGSDEERDHAQLLVTFQVCCFLLDWSKEERGRERVVFCLIGPKKKGGERGVVVVVFLVVVGGGGCVHDDRESLSVVCSEPPHLEGASRCRNGEGTLCGHLIASS